MSNYSGNPYNYPYQQSSSHQYSAYHTAPAANSIPQPPRQFPTSQSAATTQSTDYMSYSAPSYNGQGSAYGGQSDNSWGNNYGGNRDTTNRAAEVLRNMSSTPYTPSSTASATPGFTTTNASTQNARYTATSSQQPHHSHTYSQSQPRPRSVNTNRAQATSFNRGLPSPATTAGYPSQRAAQGVYAQQQQRPESTAQYSHSTPVSSARSAAMTAATQFSDYTSRQLPSVDASRNIQNPAVTAAYSYDTSQVTAPIAHPSLPASASSHYSENTTVDPNEVYDPWPEYQKQLEARRKQQALEDAARAEEERKAEEARKEEERKRWEEEQKKQQEKEEQARQAVKEKASQSNLAGIGSGGGPLTAEELESEIRAMMAKMREFNSKDPALLARIWEEERRAKVSKSLAAQNKAGSQTTAPHAKAPPAPPAKTTPAPPAKVTPAPPAANQRKKAAPKEIPRAPVAAPAVTATPATAVRAQPTVPKQPAQPAATPSRPTGNTIWPPEKRAHLANAAATYLNGQNPTKTLDASSVLSMLEGNPSYIELCEQLEAMDLKLDRAAFAKTLLNAVPDINSSSRTQARPAQTPSAAQVQAPPPPAIPKKEAAIPAAATPQYTPAAESPVNTSSFTPRPDNGDSASRSPAPIAEMVPIKPEFRAPANKEEAARKRNFKDLIDLTQLDEEEDLPPPKRQNIDPMYTRISPGVNIHDAQDVMDIDRGTPITNNFNVISDMPTPTIEMTTTAPVPAEFRHQTLVQPINKKFALRRSTYNPKTIARDVLLACGRHPHERALNAHLDILKTHLPQVTNDADLDTLNWDILDPGKPPPGYYKDGAQQLIEDADDEDESEDEAPSRVRIETVGREGGTAKVQAPLPEPTNPFKTKRRGRPPRHSFPDALTSTNTPPRATSAANMTASAPRPSSGVGYSPFRHPTEFGPDGKPLPKKRGRPVGWRKAIHGSPAAQERPGANGHTGPLNKHKPSQPSGLRNVNTGVNEPIRIDSRSPSAAPRFQSFKCKWQNCQAELHNLETLKKHVLKVHRKETVRGTLECLWSSCGKEVTQHDPMTGKMIERNEPQSFRNEASWRQHIDGEHMAPLSWTQGDGPAGGLSDANDSEAYMSDAQGRRVTPRITATPEHMNNGGNSIVKPSPTPRGRGRPPKSALENEAREIQKRVLSQKKRLGGPGMDRGGASLANNKRRKGFSDHEDTEEELVDAE
ncbi:hypothetical protein BS50DRAFT_513576 [Corynespora cassiicola Philippines]|uniref:C2H2-type domain-containing protein n=1 Tax=Corynespora cassiicola Philippines TaxID=1448308 RepID=A0A2T2P579_CORCC|nr:hypothetical protein BS50DRAFT_513576 [Corynespora cassiicola Philippines]